METPPLRRPGYDDGPDGPDELLVRAGPSAASLERLLQADDHDTDEDRMQLHDAGDQDSDETTAPSQTSSHSSRSTLDLDSGGEDGPGGNVRLRRGNGRRRRERVAAGENLHRVRAHHVSLDPGIDSEWYLLVLAGVIAALNLEYQFHWAMPIWHRLAHVSSRTLMTVVSSIVSALLCDGLGHDLELLMTECSVAVEQSVLNTIASFWRLEVKPTLSLRLQADELTNIQPSAEAYSWATAWEIPRAAFDMVNILASILFYWAYIVVLETIRQALVAVAGYILSRPMYVVVLLYTPLSSLYLGVCCVILGFSSITMPARQTKWRRAAIWLLWTALCASTAYVSHLALPALASYVRRYDFWLDYSQDGTGAPPGGLMVQMAQQLCAIVMLYLIAMLLLAKAVEQQLFQPEDRDLVRQRRFLYASRWFRRVALHLSTLTAFQVVRFGVVATGFEELQEAMRDAILSAPWIGPITRSRAASAVARKVSHALVSHPVGLALMLVEYLVRVLAGYVIDQLWTGWWIGWTLWCCEAWDEEQLSAIWTTDWKLQLDADFGSSSRMVARLAMTSLLDYGDVLPMRTPGGRVAFLETWD